MRETNTKPGISGKFPKHCKAHSLKREGDLIHPRRYAAVGPARTCIVKASLLQCGSCSSAPYQVLLKTGCQRHPPARERGAIMSLAVSAIGMLRYCQNREERKTLQSSQFLLAFDVLQRMSDAITTAQATKCAECALCACVSWSCGRSPSLQERRKGIFSTSWPCEDVAKARYCKLQQTGGSSSRNTDLGLLTV